MFKLKMITKTRMFKLKFNGIFPEVILAKTQEKETTPTKEKQEIIPDKGYDGLSKVVVEPIPDEYIIPSGEINITENGTYDVKEKVSAKVEIPEPKLGTKNITKNGIYKAIDDGLDGYSEVDVETSGVDINDYYDLTTKKTVGAPITYIKTIPLIDTSGYTNLFYWFSGYGSLETIPQLDTSKVTNMSYMFDSCRSLESIPQLDTSNVTNMSFMFWYCSLLESIPQLDASKVTNILNIVRFCDKLTIFGGLQNLGQSYLTTATENNSIYQLDLSTCTNLTYQSLMNVINGLYDIASIGVKPQQLVLGSTNLAKLTEEEIAIATNKGWTVS